MFPTNLTSKLLPVWWYKESTWLYLYEYKATTRWESIHGHSNAATLNICEPQRKLFIPKFEQGNMQTEATGFTPALTLQYNQVENWLGYLTSPDVLTETEA